MKMLNDLIAVLPKGTFVQYLEGPPEQALVCIPGAAPYMFNFVSGDITFVHPSHETPQ